MLFLGVLKVYVNFNLFHIELCSSAFWYCLILYLPIVCNKLYWHFHEGILQSRAILLQVIDIHSIEHNWIIRKVDGEGPVDNRPSTDKLHLFVGKEEEKNPTCNTWDVTRDMWHVTHEMWHVTWCGGWTFTQNISSYSSYSVWFMIFWRFEEKADWLT